jgi:hypothetical protein
MNEYGNGHYKRDPTGVWRYTISGAPVPGGRDLLISDTLGCPVREYRGSPVVEIPLAALENPLLAWAEDAACEAITAPGDPHGPVLAIYVPRASWDVQAQEIGPVGFWAPELLPERLLSSSRAAERVGLTLLTWHAEVSRGNAPSPVGWLGSKPYWTDGMLDQWRALPRRRSLARPGVLA